MKQLANLTLLTVILMLASPIFADSHSLDKPPSLLVTELTITVSEAAQKLAGIQVSPANASQYKHEINGYGRAIDLQPLLNLHNRYREALNEQRLAQAALNTAQQALDRYQELYNHGAAPLHILQNQQLLWQNARIQSDVAAVKLQAIQAETLLHWGDILTKWALTDTSSKFEKFFNGQLTLLQISLPTNLQLFAIPTVIFAEASGERSKAQSARFISSAPQNDQNDQGINYFFETNGSTIKPAMRVSAWISDENHEETGVSIPASALLWSQGNALVYIKVAPILFRQIPINHYSTSNGDYFIAGAIKPGDEIVTTGGQMLLSAQLNWRNLVQEDE